MNAAVLFFCMISTFFHIRTQSTNIIGKVTELENIVEKLVNDNVQLKNEVKNLATQNTQLINEVKNLAKENKKLKSLYEETTEDILAQIEKLRDLQGMCPKSVSIIFINHC